MNIGKYFSLHMLLDDLEGISDDDDINKILKDINTIAKGIKGLNVAKKFIPSSGKLFAMIAFF